ncbi:MAG: hypothetical protein HUU50_05785 [Candidatus Brocadiae bacterium]|nr:hypothetical protein [Candidatus Brocadiia bacterium]
MRKKIIKERVIPSDNQNWLDLEYLARVEVTSEDAAHPIESALTSSAKSGWRAEHSGQQTVRLLFDKPQRIRRIHLVFREEKQECTHEFVLRWHSDSGEPYREIVRQQYNFSPQGTTCELEDYTVDLINLTALELSIVPDIRGGDACASIEQLCLA